MEQEYLERVAIAAMPTLLVKHGCATKEARDRVAAKAYDMAEAMLKEKLKRLPKPKRACRGSFTPLKCCMLLACLLLAGCGPDADGMVLGCPPRLPRPVLFSQNQTVTVEYGFYKGHTGVIVDCVETVFEPDYWIETRNREGDRVNIRVAQSCIAGGDSDWAKSWARH